MTLNHKGNHKTATILVVCDSPSQGAWQNGHCMGKDDGEMFVREVRNAGLEIEDMAFISPCPPMDEQTSKSERKASEHLAAHRDAFNSLCSKLGNVKLVLTMGKHATQQWMGHVVKITKVRGEIIKGEDGKPAVLPMYSPRHVCVRPEVMQDFQTDLATALSFISSGFKVQKKKRKLGKYEWCEDISHLLKSPPTVLFLDTETRGLRWMRNPGTLTMQLAWEEGHAISLPFCHRYYPSMTEKQVDRLKGQVRKLLAMTHVHVLGHHLKYDLHMLANEGIEVANWHGDTLQMAAAIDENMERKGQKFCVRRWVPEMRGYSDEFDNKYDKSKMWLVPHEDMLQYGCADVDAGLRLAYVLTEIGRRDEKNWRCYTKVQMPALRMFFKMERQGLRMDVAALRKLGAYLDRQERELYDKMIAQVPAKIRRRHMGEDGDGLSFGRDVFVRDILFGPDGIKFPERYSEATKHLYRRNGSLIAQMHTGVEEDESLSTKHHLPYFAAGSGQPSSFVDDFIRYEQIGTMRTRYVGVELSQKKETVNRLASGKLPKLVITAMERAVDEGILPDDVKAGVEAGHPWRGGEIILPVKESKNGKRTELVISGRTVSWLRTDPATGFWKHITDEGKVHSTFSLDRTVTLRSASNDPNVQNLPKHNEFAPAFRRCFVASPGFKLIEVDLSQIELRIAAWMSRDPVMLRIFNSGGDIHSLTAATLMGISLEQLNKLPPAERKHKRFLAKAVNFGFIYGQWPKGFQRYAKSQFGIDLTLEQATDFRDKFFNLYSALGTWHESTERIVRASGCVRSLHGGVRRLPSISSTQKGVQNEAIRQGINAPVQRFGSDLALIGMSRFSQDCDWNLMRPLGFVHDCAVIEAREKIADTAARNLRWYAESVPLEEWFGIRPPIPLISDASIGYNLDEMEERPDLTPLKPKWARS